LNRRPKAARPPAAKTQPKSWQISWAGLVDVPASFGHADIAAPHGAPTAFERLSPLAAPAERGSSRAGWDRSRSPIPLYLFV